MLMQLKIFSSSAAKKFHVPGVVELHWMQGAALQG